jgi:hypothetical protein
MAYDQGEQDKKIGISVGVGVVGGLLIIYLVRLAVLGHMDADHGAIHPALQ